MKTIIQGKNLKTTYGVDYKWKTIKNDKGENITVYTGKPELTKKNNIVGWDTIKEFDEKVEFNSPSRNGWIMALDRNLGYINLSEEEVVSVTEKITRIDLGAYLLRTDKVLNEEVILKEESEEILQSQIAAFNKTMIESNDKLLSYCKLHKLDLAETDVDELFKLVYTDKHYIIEDGKLVTNDTIAISSSGITFRNGSTISASDWTTSTTSAIVSAIRTN